MNENSWNIISKKKLYESTPIRRGDPMNKTSAKITFRMLNTSASNHVQISLLSIDLATGS